MYDLRQTKTSVKPGLLLRLVSQTLVRFDTLQMSFSHTVRSLNPRSPLPNSVTGFWNCTAQLNQVSP